MNPLDKRYYNDPTFRQLVDVLYMHVIQQKTSFSELREALLFAQLKFELERPVQQFTFSPELEDEIKRRLK